MGFFLHGYYIGFERREFKNEDGSIDVRYSINVAVGSLAYRVYMAETFSLEEVEKFKIGQEITVSCRVYVGKNGKLSVVEGKL